MNKSDILLSIIIPCYNSERFIGSLLTRLLKEDIRYCEIIVVNDGSTDRTYSIAKKFEKSNKCIRLVNQKNKGVSEARNRGILESSGSYLMFLDSDDILTKGSIAFYKSKIRGNFGVSVISCGYCSVYNERVQKYINRYLDGKILEHDSVEKIYFGKGIDIHICSFIVYKDFLINNSLFFTVGMKIAEDTQFIVRMISKVDSLIYFNRICFVYRMRDDSVTKAYTSFGLENYKAVSTIIDTMSYLYENNFQEYYNFYLAYYYVRSLFYYLKSDYYSRDVDVAYKRYQYLVKRTMKSKSLVKFLTVGLFRIIPIGVLIELRNLVEITK